MGTIADTLLAKVNELAADGRSENQLAGDLGIQVATLHRWRKGERSISLETADKLAAVFGLALKSAKRGKR